LNTGKLEEVSRQFLGALGLCRATVRKYVYAAEARGYHQGDPTPSQGWKVFLREVIPKPPDPSTRSETFARLLPYQDEIREALATTTAATIWQRLHDEEGVKVSLPSFYRYLSCFLSDVWRKPCLTVRRSEPPPGEEAQIDFGYLGIWQDPLSGKRRRLWAFALILSFSRHMFVDNLKTGVIKADLYNPKFNQGYEELAHHYGVIIDPARSGKPKDKARVELVKTHRRGAKGERVTDWNDYPPEKAAFFQRTPDWYRGRASLIGTSTRETVDALLEEHAFHHLRQCQGILRLAEKYGQERLERACARANAFGDPAYRTVKTILERGLDKDRPYLSR